MSRVLIIDDEIENREALKRSLGDENPSWEILTAGNETEGLKTLNDQIDSNHPIDLIITDLVMTNEQSGMSVLDAARQADPSVMAILFTAKEQSLDRYRAFDLGAFDVVEKNIRGTSAAREINVKARAALRYREWSQRINFLRRYFDSRVFDTIIRDPSLLAMKSRTVTICFWDIRGFSALCESLKEHPTLIAGFLKEYCDAAARAIFSNGGVLDKFIGDGVMGLFGVLNGKDDNGKSDSLAAVSAAVGIQVAFESLQKKWLEQFTMYTAAKVDIGLGCGVHTGAALIGNVGTDFRDQFTALGAHVNFASRIQGRAVRGQILLSQMTEARVRRDVPLVDAGEINDVKNIAGTFKLYAVDIPAYLRTR